MNHSNLPEKYTPASLERVGKLIEIGNKLNKTTNSFTDPRDGKTYKTVKIGTQTWFAENLAYKADTGCWAYDNDESNVATYGYLYDWETAIKVCPKGWHLPTKDEWQTLIDYLGGEKVAGGKLKSKSGWYGPNTGATNSSGFCALPGGLRGYYVGSFRSLGDVGYWWSATECCATDAWYCYLFYYYPNAYLDYDYKTIGFSVRCIKDDVFNANNKIKEDINKEIPNSFIDNRDGKTYKTVKIGNQTWFAENLAFNASSGCWAYDNDESNVAIYGYLYDWETAKQVCPEGWHLPTNEEWQTLFDYLGGKEVAGGKLKSTSIWRSPNTSATNSSGFSALPGGYRYDGNGTFYYVGAGGGWWSYTEDGATHAWNRTLYYDGASVYWDDTNKTDGFSVRCVRDL